jgi:hypothetical protein
MPPHLPRRRPPPLPSSRQFGGDILIGRPARFTLPFHDQLVLSGGSDGIANLWRISSCSSAPLLKLNGDDDDDDDDDDDGNDISTGRGGGDDVAEEKRDDEVANDDEDDVRANYRSAAAHRKNE